MIIKLIIIVLFTGFSCEYAMIQYSTFRVTVGANQLNTVLNGSF